MPKLHFYKNYERYLSISRNDILEQASLRAAVWHQRLRPNEPVVIALGNTEEFVYSFFALILCGATPVPLSPKIELDPFFRSLDSRCFISDYEHGDIENLKKISLSEHHKMGRDTSANEEALIQFSSGSTSDPKGVRLTHKAILCNLEQIKEGMVLTERDTLCSWLPFHHDMGLIGGLLSCLYSDIDTHLMAPEEFAVAPGRWLRLISDIKCSIILGPNFQYRMLADRADSAGVDLSHLRLALCGAEPVSSHVAKRFLRAFESRGLRPEVFFPVYGMAEASLAVTFPPLGRGLFEDGLEPKHISCGRPLSGTEVRVVDAGGRVCGDGEIGQIQIRGPSLFSGYWGQKNRGMEDFFDTGDLGFIRVGELFITGRHKDLIIVRGRKIHPTDMEEAIQERCGFSGATTVFSQFNEITGEEEISIAVEARRKLDRAGFEDIIREVALQRFQVAIKKVHFLAPGRLPRTTSGKIRRFKVSELFSDGESPRDPISTSSELIQEKLRRLMSETLELPLEAVRIDKPFTGYNMDSVAVLKLNVRLREELVDIPLANFIQFKNLRDVQIYMNKKENGASL